MVWWRNAIRVGASLSRECDAVLIRAPISRQGPERSARFRPGASPTHQGPRSAVILRVLAPGMEELGVTGPVYSGFCAYRPRMCGDLYLLAPGISPSARSGPGYLAFCAFRPRVFDLLRVQAPGIWASALTAPGCLRAPHVLAPNIARCGRCPRSRVVAPARAQKTGPEADAPGPDAVCPATASQAVPSRVLSSRG